MQSLADWDFTKMLQDPFQEHQGLTVVTPTIFDLLCVFNQLPALVSTNGIGLPAAKNCVLHAAIFHILGGYGANLVSAPASTHIGGGANPRLCDNSHIVYRSSAPRGKASFSRCPRGEGRRWSGGGCGGAGAGCLAGDAARRQELLLAACRRVAKAAI